MTLAELDEIIDDVKFAFSCVVSDRCCSRAEVESTHKERDRAVAAIEALKRVQELKRYDISWTYQEIDEMPVGDWVRWADLMVALEAR